MTFCRSEDLVLIHLLEDRRVLEEKLRKRGEHPLNDHEIARLFEEVSFTHRIYSYTHTHTRIQQQSFELKQIQALVHW